MKPILGTMNIGQQVFRTDAVDMLRCFHERGWEELDTAYVYNDGSCEQILGECLQAFPEKTFKVATKVNPRISGKLDYDAVIKQCRESLSRLGLSRVDLLYFHFPDPDTPIEEPMRAAADLHREGIFNELGVSNFPLSLIEEMLCLCDKLGCPRPTVYEGVYNVLSRRAENELISNLSILGMRFYAYNPLAGGLLTGKYKSYCEKPESGRFALREKSYKGRYWKPEFFNAIQLIQAACDKENIPIAEASLRWLVNHSQLSNVRGDGIIVGASRLPQLRQNLFSMEQGPLPDSILDVMCEAYALVKDKAPEYYRFFKRG